MNKSSWRNLYGRVARLIMATSFAVSGGTVIAVADTVTTAPTAAHASVAGGPITRSEVIARAQYWVDHQPGPYSNVEYSPGPGGDYNYRRDCSGFVSMAWHLAANPSTQGLPSYSTEISRSELRAGDILNSFYNHVFLFDQWESDGIHFSYYTFGSTPVRKLRAGIYDAYFDGHPQSEYVAYRYNNIVDGGQVYEASSANGWRPLPVTGPGGDVTGSAVAAITLNGVKYVYTINGGQVYEASSTNGWRPLPVTGPGGAVTGSVVAAIALNGVKYLYTINGGQVYEASSANGWRPLPVSGPGGSVTGSAITAITLNGTKYLYTF